MIPFEVESGVVSQWTQVAQLIGEDKVNVEGAAIAYGARLIAIPKPDGSPRPIAIGCLLRRTAAAILSTRHKHKVQQAVGAKQFGINVPSGVEVFVHGFKAAVQWASKDKNRVAVKVDFKNAFNIIRRKKLLELVGSRIPSLFKYVHGCYGKHSSLFLPTGKTIPSCTGIQQGDPLSGALFAMVLADALENSLHNHACYWAAYHDDLTMAGTIDSVSSALVSIRNMCESHGLVVNLSKSERLSLTPPTDSNRGIRHCSSFTTTLASIAIGTPTDVDAVMEQK
ncbi:hypothetical protein RFI_26519 [Reticulomyxa filosa]|uniref:Reverse transcriptase domain-containing protein n=1 Tax=Reticulomyxa filosa TaxID=46433 RepID=X6MA30_RETFI|nr:hypothetical protein RFI_26519 [Reticulomyxa filosa]|eukprot:ETO10858.1 hypothetical protein RFI_26519 [Reticulomyxa filosa]